jgi:hypothetical protein
VHQGAIIDNKLLAAALGDIQRQQQQRDECRLQDRRMTLREEDLFLKLRDEPGLPNRRRRGRPTIKENALARLAAEISGEKTAAVDRILAESLERLAVQLELSPVRSSSR